MVGLEPTFADSGTRITPPRSPLLSLLEPHRSHRQPYPLQPVSAT